MSMITCSSHLNTLWHNFGQVSSQLVETGEVSSFSAENSHNIAGNAEHASVMLRESRTVE
ncbi:hypothetical protein J2S62_002688 [Enteractinococcus fodinae]|uniref:Uncharacterized protein n=1 Tax=Enteractinococcus fodinae TaxID=684663 RepID=A0ABU2B4W3_9MICC|nr:hypothetical protein [Enteractinococcus fodinae]